MPAASTPQTPPPRKDFAAAVCVGAVALSAVLGARALAYGND